MAVHLGDDVRAARCERRRLALWRFGGIAEHLARRGLVEARFRCHEAHGFEQARDAQRGELTGQLRLTPRRLHEGLRRQVVDLVGPRLAHRFLQRTLVEEIALHQIDAILDVLDAFEVGRAAAAYEPVNLVAFFEQQLGEVRAVLSRDPGQQRALQRQPPTIHLDAIINPVLGAMPSIPKAYGRAASVARNGTRSLPRCTVIASVSPGLRVSSTWTKS